MKSKLRADNIEKRAINRLRIGPSEEFSATISLNGKTLICRIEDFHFDGVKIILPEDIANESSNSHMVDSFELKYGKKSLTKIETPYVLRFISPNILILTFSTNNQHRGMRKNNRLSVKSNFRPLLMVKDPIKLNSIINLNLVNFNSTGVLLETSLSNKHLIPGVELRDIALVLPGVKIISINILIKYLKKSEKQILIGATFIDISEQDIRSLAQFAMFGTIPPADRRIDSKYREVKKTVGQVRQLGSAVRIENINTPEDYLTALQIRYEAYKGVNKIEDGATVESMADEYDERSIIIVGKIDGAIVATVRMVKCDNEKQSFPFESYLPFSTLDKGGKRSEYFEVSRLAIDPHFHGTDILLQLFKEVARQTIINNKTTVCLSTRVLRKKYLQLGFQTISKEIAHPVLKSESLALMKVNSKEFIAGKRMTATAWDLIVKDVADNLAFAEIIEKPKKSISRFFLRKIEQLLINTSKKINSRKKKI